MSINFDTLPTSNPGGGVVPKGTYFATIDKAEMRTPKPRDDGSVGKPYLNLQLSLQTADGKAAGKLFDILSESDHELVRYKLRRFIEALEIPITGNFELKDLTKIVVGKKLIVDVAPDKQNRSAVDVFSGDIYYSVAEASRIFGNNAGLTGPINAPDAEDVPFTGGTPDDY